MLPSCLNLNQKALGQMATSTCLGPVTSEMDLLILDTPHTQEGGLYFKANKTKTPLTFTPSVMGVSASREGDLKKLKPLAVRLRAGLEKAKKSVLPKSLLQDCDPTYTFILAQ